MRLLFSIMQIAFLLQGNASLLFLYLGSLRESYAFHNSNWFLKHKLIVFHSFEIKNIKSKSWIIFLKRFSIIEFWQVFYSIPFIFIYEWFNFWNSFWVSFFLPWFNARLLHIENIYHFYFSDILLFSCFLSSW